MVWGENISLSTQLEVGVGNSIGECWNLKAPVKSCDISNGETFVLRVKALGLMSFGI